MLINPIAFSDEVTSNMDEVTVLGVMYLNFSEALAVSQCTLACKLKKDGLYKCTSRYA